MPISKKGKRGNVSSADIMWPKTFNLIKTKHDEAFLAIDQAISLEERESPKEALEKYKEGVSLIDEALGIQVQCPDNPDITWEKACVMIQKINKTKAEVLQRINTLQNTEGSLGEAPLEDPPSYEEAVASSSEDDSPKTYTELARALNNMTVDPNPTMSEEVLYVHDNVRLYFISPNGEVLSTLQPQTLKISLLRTESVQQNAPRALLQVGTWMYPLVPGVSPCLRTDYGAFILPNLYDNEHPGSSVGIILPSDADKDVFDLLENILQGIVGQAQDRQREDTSSKISNSIVNGAWYLSKGLIRGAEKAGEFFDSTTPKIINNLKSAERPSEIPQPLSKSMQVAETATDKAAKVTGYVANAICTATMNLGRFLSPHIQKQGTRILTNFNMSEAEASDKMKGVLTVAAGAVEGFATVYRGLETSAVILADNLKSNSVKIVEHKYGQQAGTLTQDTFSTAVNVMKIGQNARVLTPKGILKRTAKDTGKAMVHEYTSSYRASVNYNNLGNGSDEAAGCSYSDAVKKVGNSDGKVEDKKQT